jgi:hypothetical protein
MFFKILRHIYKKAVFEIRSRIDFGRLDPDPGGQNCFVVLDVSQDPGGQKCFGVLDFSGLKDSPVARTSFYIFK